MNSQKILQISRRLILHKKGRIAIRYLYYGIQHDPENVELLLCLGDALKQMVELDLALKIYKKALTLAKKYRKKAFIDQISTKIENVYILTPNEVPKSAQIGFFIRSLMKMLNQLGKKDWF
ncbi:MAG: hypothetical protein ACTSRS_20000 [Candidatus Helarchaeota archaeon]